MANANWPKAEAINSRIARSEVANGRISHLHAKGDMFLHLGAKYGINPAVVVAISQRECQLGADGSTLPTVFNFGGITDPGSRGPCGRIWVKDRFWAQYCNVDQGIEAIFALLDGANYRSTDGTLRGIMTLYSPPFENDWVRMWEIFDIVGKQLGVTLNASTPVYLNRTAAPQKSSSGTTPKLPVKVRIRRALKRS